MVSHMPVCTAGVAVAITLNYLMYLDRDAQQAIQAANLSHLLAIFGPHVDLLNGLVFVFKRAIFHVLPI